VGVVQPARQSAPWFLWPLAAVWDLLAFILRVTGRVLGIILGLVLLGSGIALSLTVVGAPIGVPLAALGFLLLVRCVF